MKILVVRFRRVGDAVLSMSLVHSLARSFPAPQGEIHFVINRAIAPLFEGHPDIGRVIPFSEEDCHGLRYVRKVWNLCRAERYDAIIDMRSTLKTSLFALFSPGARYRIGRRKPYTLGLHNYRIPLDKKEDRLVSNLGLLAPLEKEGHIVRDLNFPLHITPAEREAYAAYLRRSGLDLARPVVLCAVTTRIPGKAWRADRMAAVLGRFIETHPDAQLVFNYSGAAEAADARALHALMGHDRHVLIDIEARDLRQLCCLCLFSTLYFGNEGGVRHIAQSLDTPSLAIYPPYVDMRVWLPGSSPDHCGLTGATMDDISVEQVSNALEASYARAMARRQRV